MTIKRHDTEWAVLYANGDVFQRQSESRELLVYRLLELYDTSDCVVIPWGTYVSAHENYSNEEIYNIYGGSKVYEKLPHPESETQEL